MLKEALEQPKYDMISRGEKDFILNFHEFMTQNGYGHHDIQPYVCFELYKIEYFKLGLKTKNVVARFYFRKEGFVLRLYFKNIQKHVEYIEKTPDFIQEPFIKQSARCNHCENGFYKDGVCKFRKIYTLHGELIEKCSGECFMYYGLNPQDIDAYTDLFEKFYPIRSKTVLS